jgi:hypothetical protein
VQQVQLNSLQSPRKMSSPKEQIRDGTGPDSKLLPTSKIPVSHKGIERCVRINHRPKKSFDILVNMHLPRAFALPSSAGMVPSKKLSDTLNVSVMVTRNT